MFRRFPVWSTVFAISGVWGMAVVVAAVFGILPVDANAVVGAIFAVAIAPFWAIFAYEGGVHPHRARLLEARSPGAHSWAGTPAESLSAILTTLNDGASFFFPLKIIVLMEANELSLWRMRGGKLTQCLRAERSAIVRVRRARVSAIDGDEDHVFITVENGDAPVELEIQPTIFGAVNRKLLTFDGTESARVLTQRWLNESGGTEAS